MVLNRIQYSFIETPLTRMLGVIERYFRFSVFQTGNKRAYTVSLGRLSITSKNISWFFIKPIFWFFFFLWWFFLILRENQWEKIERPSPPLFDVQFIFGCSFLLSIAWYSFPGFTKNWGRERGNFGHFQTIKISFSYFFIFFVKMLLVSVIFVADFYNNELILLKKLMLFKLLIQIVRSYGILFYLRWYWVIGVFESLGETFLGTSIENDLKLYWKW